MFCSGEILHRGGRDQLRLERVSRLQQSAWAGRVDGRSRGAASRASCGAGLDMMEPTELALFNSAIPLQQVYLFFNFY